MQINLDLIKPSPHPVRTTWDDDKLNELAQSIKEQGLIVPIKVRLTTSLPSCRWHGTDWLEEYQIYEGNDEPCVFCGKWREEYGIFDEWELGDDDDLQESIQSARK